MSKTFHIADSESAKPYFSDLLTLLQAAWPEVASINGEAVPAPLVVPVFRRQGIGSLLVRGAIKAAEQFGLDTLYALTEIPCLYSNLGWSVLSQDGADCVMTSVSPGPVE